MEEELRKQIEAEEEKLSKQQRTAADKLFRRDFGGFWNGVSSGWEN
jgi:hypothetical protein